MVKYCFCTFLATRAALLGDQGVQVAISGMVMPHRRDEGPLLVIHAHTAAFRASRGKHVHQRNLDFDSEPERDLT